MSIILLLSLISGHPFVCTTQDDLPKIQLEDIRVCGAQYYCAQAIIHQIKDSNLLDSPKFLFFIQEETSDDKTVTRKGFFIIPFHVFNEDSLELVFSFLIKNVVQHECTVKLSKKHQSLAHSVCLTDGITTFNPSQVDSMRWWIPDLTTDALMTCTRDNDDVTCYIATQLKISEKSSCKLYLEDTLVTDFDLTNVEKVATTQNVLEIDFNTYKVTFKITEPLNTIIPASAIVSLISDDSIFEQKVSKKDLISQVDSRDHIPPDANVRIVVDNLNVHFCDVGKRKISIVGALGKATESKPITSCLDKSETNAKKDGITLGLRDKDSTQDFYVRERLPFSGILSVWKYSIAPNGDLITTVPECFSKHQIEFCDPQTLMELVYVTHTIDTNILKSTSFKIKSENKNLVGSLKTCYPAPHKSTNERKKINEACEIYELELKFESEKIQELPQCKLMQIDIETGRDEIVKSFFYEVVKDNFDAWKFQKVEIDESESGKSKLKEKLKLESEKYIEEKAKKFKSIVESGFKNEEIDKNEVGKILINQIQDTVESIAKLVVLVNPTDSDEKAPAKEESVEENKKKKKKEPEKDTKSYAEMENEKMMMKEQEEKETVKLSLIEEKFADIKVNITEKNIAVVYFEKITKFEEIVVEISDNIDKKVFSMKEQKESETIVKKEKNEKPKSVTKSSVKIKGSLMENKQDVTVAYYKVDSGIKQKFATGIVVITDSDKAKRQKSESGAEGIGDTNKDIQDEVDLKQDDIVELIFNVQTASVIDHLTCGWIRGNMSTFRTEGCYTNYFLNKSIPNTEVICVCNHLTSFAVLFGAETKHQPILMKNSFSIISYVCTSISIVLLSCIIVVKYREKRTMKNREIIYLSINYLCLYVAFLVADFSPYGSLVCASMKYISAFFVVHLYCTILIFGIRVYKNLITVSLQRSWIVQKSALVLPTVFSIIWICITIGLTRSEHRELCFISPYWSKILLLPIYILVIVINSIIALRAYLRIKARAQSKNNKEMDSTSKNLLIYLCMILGFTWFLQLLIPIHWIFELCFIVVNGSQGILLYINLFKAVSLVKKKTLSMSYKMSSSTRETSIRAFSGWKTNKSHFDPTGTHKYISFDNL